MSKCSLLTNSNLTNKLKSKSRTDIKCLRPNSFNLILIIVLISNLNTLNLDSTTKNLKTEKEIKIEDIIFPANTPEPKVSTLERTKLVEYINKVRQNNDKTQGIKSSSGSLSSEQYDRE